MLTCPERALLDLDGRPAARGGLTDADELDASPRRDYTRLLLAAVPVPA